jgi:hypothetical protein
MKLSEPTKRALREWRRYHRATVTKMEISARVVDVRAIEHLNPRMRANYQVAANVWASLIEEFRATADMADQHLRRDDMSADESDALRRRVDLVEAKLLALADEVSATLKE